jgi:hypothetical protein
MMVTQMATYLFLGFVTDRVSRRLLDPATPEMEATIPAATRQELAEAK